MAYLRSWTSNLLCVACLAIAGCATGQGDSNIRDPGREDGATTNTGDRPGPPTDASVGDDIPAMGMQDVPPGSMDTPNPMDTLEQDTGMSELDAGMMSMPDTGVGPVDTGVIVTMPDTGVIGLDVGFPTDVGFPRDTGTPPTDTGMPTDTGSSGGLMCPSGLGTTTCGTGRNCCLSVAFGLGLGCGCSPIPGFFPCLPTSGCI